METFVHNKIYIYINAREEDYPGMEKSGERSRLNVVIVVILPD